MPLKNALVNLYNRDPYMSVFEQNASTNEIQAAAEQVSCAQDKLTNQKEGLNWSD